MVGLKITRFQQHAFVDESADLFDFSAQNKTFSSCKSSSTPESHSFE
jgi:hypothetical protein